MSRKEAEVEDAGVGGELAETLARRRLYREVTLALRTGLRDAKAEFSFLRARGLRSLLGFLRSTASAPDDSQLLLFRHSPVHPRSPRIHCIKQRKILLSHWITYLELSRKRLRAPPTDSEIALALRVLEGCCLLYSRCTALAHKYKAVKVLLNILASRGPTEQGVCLDALISLMLDSPPNQIEFEVCSGLEKVAELLKDEQVEEHIRLKCGEFLLLLIGHVYAKENTPIHEHMRNLLGELCASLVWAAS